MCARNERYRGSPPDVRGELESPFLDEELFTGEAEEEWEQRLAALEAESPFLHAFEGFAAPGYEPEAGDEEAEDDLSPDEEGGWGEEAAAQLFEAEESLGEAHDQFEDFETRGDGLPASESGREAEELLEAWGEGEEEARGEDEESFEMPAWEIEAWLAEQEREEPPAGFTGFEAEDEAPAVAAVAAGREAIRNVPQLARHRAPAPDLIVTWNTMAAPPRVVDVVVHLHGFSMSKGKPLNAADRATRSGLDWSDPGGKDASPGRRRPTVGLIPKGHFYGGKTGRGHSFPALLTSTGLQGLIDFGLGWLARRLGVTDLKAGRVILTAHSGGGAALLKILGHFNPHEIHLFDALYQSPTAVVDWARARLAADRAALEAGATSFDDYMSERGGALRVLYRPGTATERHSLAARDALDLTIPAGSPLARWYKVDSTRVPHLLVGPRYGWRLLADAGAALPDTTPPRPSLKKRETTEGEWESPDPSDEGWELERRDLDDPEAERLEAGELEGWGEASEEEAEAPAVNEVVFPSGVSLRVLTGLPVGRKEDYWDPTGSGLPLLDTGHEHKDKKLSASFTVRELTTSGGVSADIARIDPKLVECLQRLRDHVGKSITITSGFRSWARNRAVYEKRGKEPTHSQHCAGRAVDIRVKGMSGLAIGKAAIEACGPSVGVGLADTFAHLDVRGCAAAWKYGGQVPGSWEAEIERLQKEKGGTPCGAKPKAAPPATTPKATTGGPKPAPELTRFAQRVLNAAEGQSLAVDGDFGPRTVKAVEEFRRRHGLGAGGALDGPTQLALAQRALEELAQQSIFPQYGKLDAKTGQALSDFKTGRGLGSDPTPDAATRAALADALAARKGQPGTSRPSRTPAPAPSPSSKASDVSVKHVAPRGDNPLKLWKGVKVDRTAHFRPSPGERWDVVLAATSAAEGGFDTVNMYDRGILSWGIMQWTLHAGSLQKALAFIKKRLAELGQSSLWTRSFPDLDVRNGVLVYRGEVVTTDNNDRLRKIFRGAVGENDYMKETAEHWARLFARAGREPVIQQLQSEYARREVDELLAMNLGDTLARYKNICQRPSKKNSTWGYVCRRLPETADVYRSRYRRVADYIGQELKAITLLFGMKDNNPAGAYIHFKQAIDALAVKHGTHDIERWPASWRSELSARLEQVFLQSDFAMWGEAKAKKVKRESRTRKILDKFNELTRAK